MNVQILGSHVYAYIAWENMHLHPVRSSIIKLNIDVLDVWHLVFQLMLITLKLIMVQTLSVLWYEGKKKGYQQTQTSLQLL